MNRCILPVTAALLWRADRLLITQRLPSSANANLWELPGGKLEFGERPEECLRRELREELGLQASVQRLYGVFSHVATDELQILLIVYHCHPGIQSPEAIECQGLRWVTVSEALGYDLAPLDREIILGLADLEVENR